MTCALLLAAAAWIAFPGDAVHRVRLGEARSRGPRRRSRHEPARSSPVGASVIDLISAGLDAGLALASAVAAVGAALPGRPGAPLRRAVAFVEVTGELGWRPLCDDPEIGPLAQVMARSADSGAPVAEAMRVLAADLRRLERAARMERARRVGVRTAAPLGLCFLPAFFIVAVVPTVIGLIGAVL